MAVLHLKNVIHNDESMTLNKKEAQKFIDLAMNRRLSLEQNGVLGYE